MSRPDSIYLIVFDEHKWFDEFLKKKLTLENITVCRRSYLTFISYTVKPLITNTSEEFIKCRLDNFSMSFILYYANFSICENK